MKERIISTKKMIVIINSDSVTKKFKKSYGYKKRYNTEKKALNLLSELNGIPKILSFSDETTSLTVSKLEGKTVSEFSDKILIDLKSKMFSIIELGVARHSFPERDIIVDNNQNIGIVDFERATIKEDSWLITWNIASLVAKFHTYRLIFRHNPNLLSVG